LALAPDHRHDESTGQDPNGPGRNDWFNDETTPGTEPAIREPETTAVYAAVGMPAARVALERFSRWADSVEAVNLLTKKIKRIGHGFRNFAKYRLRLHCGVSGRLTGP
jgi:hypothetical protein